MQRLFTRLIRQDEAQDLIEYALLAAFISVTSLSAFSALGGDVGTIYKKVSATIGVAQGTGGDEADQSAGEPPEGGGRGNGGNGNGNGGGNGNGNGNGGNGNGGGRGSGNGGGQASGTNPARA